MNKKIGLYTDALQLDSKVRHILMEVTPETSLSAVQQLAALGFSPQVSFETVCRVIRNRPADTDPSSNGLGKSADNG